MPREDIPNIIRATQLGDVCVSWLFVRPESEIISHAVTYWKPALACQALGLLAPNDTVVRKTLWPVTQHTLLNPDWGGLLQRAKPDALVTKRLSGEQLTVACAKYFPYRHKEGSCDHPSAVRIFQTLKDNYNLSVNFRNVFFVKELVRGIYRQEWDMTYVLLVIQEDDVFISELPLISLGHETFFSRKSASRTVTLSQVSWESRRIMAATLTLIGLVALTQALITEGVRPSVQGAADTVSLLMAAVLGTSTTERTRGIRRGRFLRRALFGIWFVFILPLSTYLRSELTSILTLKRPLDRIDTLEELGDALDGGAVAPCCLDQGDDADECQRGDQDSSRLPADFRERDGSMGALARKERLVAKKDEREIKGEDFMFRRNSVEAGHVPFLKTLKDNYNLSVNFRNVFFAEEMARGMYRQEWDMTYVLLVIPEHEVFISEFPHIFLGHETFFSRKSASRTVTLSEVSWESRRIMAATLTLIGLVALTQALITEGVRPSVQGAADTVSLLLAAVLATSTTEPARGIRRGRFLRRALFGIWFVFIFPLSAYLRSELTSILTLKRPLERIDTLEELEDALDGGAVAPCVLANTVPHYQLTVNESDVADGSLMRKLRAAFKLHGPEKLSARKYSHCLACALRNDRVCYGLFEMEDVRGWLFEGVSRRLSSGPNPADPVAVTSTVNDDAGCTTLLW
ncbi:hypothetical protein HPB52_015591 [Rhipicephalus sanguineus]|uniref:Uncharacterized protein n=1 Tax=Rhipicephalus sanguineus TaxID=34632 RepID=A0A9D4PBS4_RHISA|nr:hypothetical protein HPB52_015591 [Rhipicephalus sanguineus]